MVKQGPRCYGYYSVAFYARKAPIKNDTAMKTTATVAIIIILKAVTKAAAAISLHGEKCAFNSDCEPGLVCSIEDKLFDPQRVCQCKAGLDWVKGQGCQNLGEKAEEDVASLVTVLVPVLASVIATCVIVICCCCWIHSSTITLEREMKKAIKGQKYEEIELEMQQPIDDVGKPEPQAKKKTRAVTIEKERPKSSKEERPAEDEEDKGQQQIKADPHARKISTISDPAYQANMRSLLNRPHSSFLSVNNNGLYSRPHSATFINIDSRPPSALARSASDLARSVSVTSINGRKSSPAINRPYLTETAFKRPPSLVSLRNGGELAKLYDHILKVNEASEVNKVDQAEKATEKAAKASQDRKKSDAGIEEIRLVRVAVNAFKKRKRLKDLGKGKKRSKFESVVDKVMRLREFEQKHVYKARTASREERRSSSSNSTLTSSLPSSSSSISSSKGQKRPESVAQRVLRERKEKNISTKTPVSASNARPKTSSASKKRQPLHVALRKSASSHGSRSVLANKIKQQAHFSALKNFQVNIRKKRPCC